MPPPRVRTSHIIQSRTKPLYSAVPQLHVTEEPITRPTKELVVQIKGILGQMKEYLDQIKECLDQIDPELFFSSGINSRMEFYG